MSAAFTAGEPATVWFLIACDDATTIRIRSGLTLREDADGNVRVLGAGDPEGWLRFTQVAGRLWAEVVDPAWTLSSGTRDLGRQLPIDASLELHLPHHAFAVSDALAVAPTRRTPIRLVPAAVAAQTPAATEPAARDLARLQKPEVPSLEPPGDVAPTPVPAIAPATRAKSPATRQEPVLRGAAAPADRRGASPPVAGIGRPAAALEPTSGGAGSTAPAGHRPVSVSRPPPAVSRAREPRPRYQVAREASLLVTAATLALFIVSLGFSTRVQTPTGGGGLAGSAVAATGTAEVTALRASVERMLRRSRAPDRATLAFAVEAYRSAHRELPDNASVEARLRELESLLAQSIPRR